MRIPTANSSVSANPAPWALPGEIVGTAFALLGRGACLPAVGRSHALHPSILRGVRLIGVNSDNEPEPPDLHLEATGERPAPQLPVMRNARTVSKVASQLVSLFRSDL